MQFLVGIINIITVAMIQVTDVFEIISNLLKLWLTKNNEQHKMMEKVSR